MNTVQEAPPAAPLTVISPRPAAAFQPLRLNLLHEQQAAVAQAKRDPLKLGLYALGGVALLLVAFYVYRAAVVGSIQRQLVTRQAEFAAKYEKPLKTVDAKEKEFSALSATGNALRGRMEGRFLWAPLLETLQRVVPREVQLVGMSGSTETKEGGRTVSLTIEGIAAGVEPRDTAARFLKTLNEKLAATHPGATGTFRNLDDGDATIALDGKTLTTAKFTIVATFRPGAPAPVAPEPAAAAKKPAR